MVITALRRLLISSGFGVRRSILLDVDVPVVIIQKERKSRRQCPGKAVRLEHGFVQEAVLCKHPSKDVELHGLPLVKTKP